MIKKMFTLMIIWTLFFQLFLIFVFIPQSASGNPLEPTVELILLEEEKTANYSDENAYVTFNGIVNATINPVTRVIVSLDGSDTWDSAVVSPDSLLFADSGEQPFSVEVRVRPGEDYGFEGMVTVNGYWTMYPGVFTGTSNSASAKIIVGQYFNFFNYLWRINY